MTKPIYYYLTDVETMLAVSRETVTRLGRAGLILIDGQGKQRRAKAATVETLRTLIDEGADLWELLEAAESGARIASATTGAAVSTLMPRARNGASSRRNAPASDSHASTSDQETPARRGPAWLRPIG